MAKRVLSMICLSVAAGSSNLVGRSPSAITGKSSRGSVERLKRARPATTCILPSDAESWTCEPSGSLRAISNRVCAETVVAPGVSTAAATVSTTCRSRSVAISLSVPSARRLDQHVRQDRNRVAPLDHRLDVAEAFQKSRPFDRRLHVVPSFPPARTAVRRYSAAHRHRQTQKHGKRRRCIAAAKPR